MCRSVGLQSLFDLKSRVKYMYKVWEKLTCRKVMHGVKVWSWPDNEFIHSLTTPETLNLAKQVPVGGATQTDIEPEI